MDWRGENTNDNTAARIIYYPGGKLKRRKINKTSDGTKIKSGLESKELKKNINTRIVF